MDPNMIAMNVFDLLVDLHKNMENLGPGGPEITKKGGILAVSDISWATDIRPENYNFTSKLLSLISTKYSQR
jgi:hypothetical protein